MGVELNKNLFIVLNCRSFTIRVLESGRAIIDSLTVIALIKTMGFAMSVADVSTEKPDVPFPPPPVESLGSRP